MVSAEATAIQTSLGETIVDEKSNVISKLLEITEVSGSLVTVDAMGCQTKIAAKIISEDAGYWLAGKGNQPTLHDGIKDFFVEHLENNFAAVDVIEHHNKEKRDGRVDHRSYYVCKLPAELPDASRCAGLEAIGMSINNM